MDYVDFNRPKGGGIPHKQDKERFHQAAVFLQDTGEDILPGIRLELTDEERGCHPAELERARQPQEVLPMGP